MIRGAKLLHGFNSRMYTSGQKVITEDEWNRVTSVVHELRKQLRSKDDEKPRWAHDFAQHMDYRFDRLDHKISLAGLQLLHKDDEMPRWARSFAQRMDYSFDRLDHKISLVSKDIEQTIEVLRARKNGCKACTE